MFVKNSPNQAAFSGNFPSGVLNGPEYRILQTGKKFGSNTAQLRPKTEKKNQFYHIVILSV
jgi:hypothetical protein